MIKIAIVDGQHPCAGQKGHDDVFSEGQPDHVLYQLPAIQPLKTAS